ncbi:putative leucine-rich repeat receptor-like serine/threonine-protein kinase At2g24130 [Abrus precatorius]|uniref:Leucine-rich repeat receptor-like serine/threonine-protein kinase At2g24130 n=1 Tax=Abrus precatorius TaxID=3816 RepID=A0A8B8LPT1_ABRPR|nr:putative leucine-rich repeat receptor-like serine/threonine-protein kinase At2g24130 [Abrus precatorius]
MLSTWSDDDSNPDCCKWKGIQCHNETDHVQMLDLRGQDNFLSGAVNFTPLVHLQKMEYLDLSYNDFQSSHIPELIGSFTNLRYLNISYSQISGRIPCELGKLAHLQYLGLGSNYLDGEIPYQLGNLSRLKYLDLSGNSNSFFGAIPFHVGNLPNLHTLRLGGNFDVESVGLPTMCPKVQIFKLIFLHLIEGSEKSVEWVREVHFRSLIRNTVLFVLTVRIVDWRSEVGDTVFVQKPCSCKFGELFPLLTLDNCVLVFGFPQQSGIRALWALVLGLFDLLE